MSYLTFLLAATVLVPVVASQGAAYAQCGGKHFTGSTNCVSGYSCILTNEWYSQCLPGTAAPGSPVSSPAISGLPSKASLQPTASASAMPLQANKVASTPEVNQTTSSTAYTNATTSTDNPFTNVQLYVNPYYADEVNNLAIPNLTAALAVKASAVAKIPSFAWLDTQAKVPSMETYLADIETQNAAGASPPIIGQFVVYDLPDRDCAALASNGEFAIADGGIAKYKAYVDSIAEILKNHTQTNVVLVVEPDSIANLVTNLNVPKCAGAEAAYKECVTYTLQELNMPHVTMYMDAGHAGWLGWPANLQPAATLYASLFTAAGSPASVRGLATNVANYNGFETACPSYTTPNVNCNEKLFINAFAPLLETAGFPSHFIVDTGRSGVQPAPRNAWGDWCNIVGTGFGVRPTTETGDGLVDAFVWVKPGGESDGTSDSTANRYDGKCGLPSSLKPAPQAGTWFQSYFEQLLTNANPAL